MLRHTILAAVALASLAVAPMASANPVGKPLNAKQMALIMQMSRAHRGMGRSEHAVSAGMGLAVVAALVGGLAIGLGTSQKTASPN